MMDDDDDDALVGKSEGKRPCGMHRRVDSIKMDLRETDWAYMEWIYWAQGKSGYVDWIYLAQGRGK
jgi:hypothetical protein